MTSKRRIKVIRAEAMGLCFGVRDALATARSVENPKRTAIYGELVHNNFIQNELAASGFRSVAEADRTTIPPENEILITAHGISDTRRSLLLANFKNLIDTTCPLVLNVHRAAKKLCDENRFVVVIGKKNHVEVAGIIEDLPRHAVVETEFDVRFWGERRIGIISQSTIPPKQSESLISLVRKLNPAADIRALDTICGPTRDRQAAIEKLAREVEVIVVVGGVNSNNTLQLARRVEELGRAAIRIGSADEIVPQEFAGFDRVGLTAGTSTPDNVVDNVEAALSAIEVRSPHPLGLPAALECEAA